MLREETLRMSCWSRQRKIRQLKATGSGESIFWKWNLPVAEDNKGYPDGKTLCRSSGKRQGCYKTLAFLLLGRCRHRKSFVAACNDNALLEQGILVLMTNFSKILNRWVPYIRKSDTGISRFISNYSLLILDDLGIECITEGALEQVTPLLMSGTSPDFGSLSQPI